MQTNKGYQLPDKILNELGSFESIITRYYPGITFTGRALAHCLTKVDEPIIEMFKEHQSGLLVVNTRVETIQFQNLLESAHSVLFLKGRVRFRDMKYNAIIPSNAPYGTAIFSFSQSDTFVLYNSGLNGKVICLKQPDIAEFPKKKSFTLNKGQILFNKTL
jgi:hypothetical protein